MTKNNFVDSNEQPLTREFNLHTIKKQSDASYEKVNQDTKHIKALVKTISNTPNELEVINNSYDKGINNIKERDTKHFAPANKEWKNSVYSFNKSYLSNLPVRDKIISNYIKNYFFMRPVPSKITKSKRMRGLSRRSSTRQLFVTTPEIKQTNDKAIINLYTYDREQKFSFSELFNLRKWLNESLLRSNLNESHNHLITKFTNNLEQGFARKKHIFSYKQLSKRQRRSTIKRFMSKYRVKPNLYIKTIKLLLKKKSFITNKIIFGFLKRIFKILNLKIKIVVSHNRTLGKGKNKYVRPYVNLVIRKKNKKTIVRSKDGKIRYIKVKPFDTIKMRNNHFNLDTLKGMNIILFARLKNYYKNLNTGNLLLRFEQYKDKYKQVLSQRYLKKEIFIIKNLSNLYINKFKSHAFLPGLKSKLSLIYGKNIQLNIVNLKYLHLNSDMFSEAISIKLRNRTTSLLRILRKSFNLVKAIRPNDEFISLRREKNMPVKEINTFLGKYNVINGNIINEVFKEIFNRKKLSSEGLNTTKETLRSIKYKWVTGIRIEAKGRLTKRYAASRALFKYKYRGALRNLEYLRNLEDKFQSPSVFMLRGQVRPNTQYSLVHSKRRIGAFGIKGWISNN